MPEDFSKELGSANEIRAIRVAAFTGGTNVPSARFRVRQYIGALQKFGVDLTELNSQPGSYPPAGLTKRVWWGIRALAERIADGVESYKFDVTLLQREFLSTFVTLEPLTNAPRVLDVDDAIWLHRGGRAARSLARLSNLVICGNSYLADWFSAFNRNVRVLPTAVDTERYLPDISRSASDRLVIGWIGTSPNLKYLQRIERQLGTVLHERPNTRLHVVCDKPPVLASLDQSRVQFVRWSEDSEVLSLQQMDIGIMPLEDSEWARGKCSFKMLQYMSCGLPSVVSPVGANAEILRAGDVAIGASSEDEWVDALTTLLDNATARADMGKRARRIAEEHYSVRALAPRFARHLRESLVC